MPGRVRQFNAEQATILAASLQCASPGTTPAYFPVITAACPSCGSPLIAGVKFCSRCGAAIAQ